MITSINSTLFMNIKLIWTSQIFNQFNLNVQYKFDKKYIVFNAFFRFANVSTETLLDEHSRLNIFFTYNFTFVEMSNQFYDKILKNYFKNSIWKKISTMIKNDETFENNVV